MKAIYTVIDEEVCRVRQNTKLPHEIVGYEGECSSRLSTDPTTGFAMQSIYINTLQVPKAKSNREKYDELIYYLKTNKITEILSISNFFICHIDYTIYENGRIIDKAVVMHPVCPRDKVLPLGIASNNEDVFRRVKTFKHTIEFNTTRPVPHGIMYGKSKHNRYELKINDIKVYEKISDPEIHRSIYNDPYDEQSEIVAADVDDSLCIFSALEGGIVFDPVVLNFRPRRVGIDVNLVLTDWIVAFTDKEINKIIEDNKRGVTPDPEPIIPEDDKNVPADGDETPDKDGYYDYYERATPTNPNSKLVVVDSMEYPEFNSNSMIHKSYVIKDIPDIEIGEYVIYREVLTEYDL